MNPKQALARLATAGWLALGLVIALPVQAEGKPTGWVTPVIQGYGKVHPRPDLAVQPDPDADYRLFVRVVAEQPPKDPSKVLPQLDRLARLVNLMGVAKVPPAHVHIVALLDEAALLSATTDAVYGKRTGAARNPNLPLLHALKQAGVQVLVCGQALAGMELPDAAVVPDATITLSALTDMAVYGQRGYSYMQL